MTAPLPAAFGSWKSPISADLIVAKTINLLEIHVSGQEIYWIEGRPLEAGRSVLVKWNGDGTTTDLIPEGFNARTRVHEYGGAPVLVDGETVYFSNYRDQRLYRTSSGSSPEAITPETQMRYADAVIDRAHQRLICVCEDHTQEGHEARNFLGAVALDGSGTVSVLVEGNDFYSTPRLSPDGKFLTWIEWSHPNLPWDGTELWMAEVAESGEITNRALIAGGRTVSIVQPTWSPSGELYFVSDQTGWWNLYRWRSGDLESVCPMEAEFAEPHWIFGMTLFAIESAGRMVCSFIQNGQSRLATLNLQTGDFRAIELPYTKIWNVTAIPGAAVFCAASPTESSQVVRLDLETLRLQVLRQSSTMAIDERFLAVPQAIEFPTEHGLTAHAFYYPPTNPDFEAPEGEKPPLLVKCHGGPTGQTYPILTWGYQYWTSRGLAVLDVNYGGSTGYGREYRERLRAEWGVVDVEDCINAARYVVDQGLVDGNRLAIDGGSAGGYTVLCALTFHNVFHAGASFYGVSDALALVRDTHKFESRYQDFLFGPDWERVCVERSPIHYVDQLSCPVIFFQGLEDKVVPPNQAEMMVAALERKGLPVAYVAYEGEQHGFRKAENIKRTLDGEFYFYSRIFGFSPADDIEPVQMRNEESRIKDEE